MAQWGKNDAASNSVVWGPALLNQAPTRANANALYGNTTADAYITGRTDAVVGIDESEAEVISGNPGWTLMTKFSGGRAGRVQYETLVAMSSMDGPDADGDLVADISAWFTSEPPALLEVEDGGNTSISVSVATKPAGKTVSYQWEANTGSGFANLSSSGFYSGANTDTLVISGANSTIDDVSYRVVVRATGMANLVSSETTLTVTA